MLNEEDYQQLVDWRLMNIISWEEFSWRVRMGTMTGGE